MAQSDTKATWRQRVASWRASGQTAEEFSGGREFSAATLRWWASRLRREPAAVRVARVVRAPDPRRSAGAVVVELRDVAARVTVEPGADRETLAMVVAVLAARGAA